MWIVSSIPTVGYYTFNRGYMFDTTINRYVPNYKTLRACKIKNEIYLNFHCDLITANINFLLTYLLQMPCKREDHTISVMAVAQVCTLLNFTPFPHPLKCHWAPRNIVQKR